MFFAGSPPSIVTIRTLTILRAGARTYTYMRALNKNEFGSRHAAGGIQLAMSPPSTGRPASSRSQPVRLVTKKIHEIAHFIVSGSSSLFVLRMVKMVTDAPAHFQIKYSAALSNWLLALQSQYCNT